jgi:tetratricopeptide (TPR) repeat protein
MTKIRGRHVGWMAGTKSLAVTVFYISREVFLIGAFLLCIAASCEEAKLPVRDDAFPVLDKIYSGELDAGIAAARRLQEERPQHPLGYLLEGEVLWWKIWCTSAEFKYGMTFPRHRAKLAADQHYLELAAKISALAAAQIAREETAEMQFYAGMADAMAGRLYGLRWESHNTARAGVHAREHLLRAITLDPDFADAYLGLGLYNYYVDTLSGGAKVLRFFMGIPGGSKREGIGQLQRAIAEGVLAPPVARFYLAINLHNYDRQYDRALEVLDPLVDKYPSNPIFQLARGDLYAKLGRKEQAIECYQKALGLPFGDEECQKHIRELARAALAAVGSS